MSTTQIGTISSSVIQLLGLSGIAPNTPIYLGNSNVIHMISKHESDYRKYGADIPLIIAYPDYVGLNPNDTSIEYVKEYKINNEYVKVAVRVSNNGNYFARSIYVLNNQRVMNFIAKNTLKKT